MAFKPNYNFQRMERDRLKQAKKEAKQRERNDAAAAAKRKEDDSPQDEASAPNPDAQSD